jgi:TetR/AcrR family transcriptional repressor of nem operon
MAAAAGTDTATRILDVATRLVQVHGFNAFSYADVSAELRITKASLHHHFPTKAALGRALIARYKSTFLESLGAIDRRGGDARGKLKSYAELYASVLRQERMCLCGMLAADFATLPKPMRSGVTEFFRANEEWLAKVLEDGRKSGTLRFDGGASSTAELIVSSLEGAMLVARAYGSVSRFESVAGKLLSGLGGRA